MNPLPKRFALIFLALLVIQSAFADYQSLKNWKGFTHTKENENTASLAIPGSTAYTYPDGEKGWHRVGAGFGHDGSANWLGYYGVRFDIHLPIDATLKAEAMLGMAPKKVYGGNEDVADTYTARFGVAGSGWHTVTVPLSAFDTNRMRPVVLESVKSFTIKGAFNDGQTGEIQIRNPQLVKADIISLESSVRSRSAKPGKIVTYDLLVSNWSRKPQAVNLAKHDDGMEAMETKISPSEFTLNPGESQACTVQVTVSTRVPQGGNERQTIQALANGRDAGDIEFITLAYLEHPYLLHDKKRWDAVREKVKNVDWAKEEAKKFIASADQWIVPERAINAIARDTGSAYLYDVKVGEKLYNTAIAYQLTKDKKYAKKVAKFIRDLVDPVKGYPTTRQAGSGNLVKEGGLFQKITMSYDMIYNAGVLTEADHARFADSIRIYQSVIDQHISDGASGNWQVSELTGALYGALAIQDMVAANRFIEGPGGFLFQASNGIMSDGWWYECSIGYNAWVASEFTQIALAMQPFGIDFVDAAIPATYSKEYNILSVDVERRKQMIYGKPFQKWGPVHKPYVKIKDMWDALPPLVDYDGVMFANNDSVEQTFKTNYYEMAYAVYGDPIYASLIKFQKNRDLLYGLPEIPEVTPATGVGSAFSDNAGQAMLRSNQEDPRERIQAVLKYGTHGGYHGHFDRAGLNSIMRYGRSFYNPENVWYGYKSFMYTFYVETSLPHNMVVVDMKQQEATESSKLHFSTGELFQTTTVETKARWSNPPYGGLKYSWFSGTFQEKLWDEGRYVPQPENEPEYGSIGEWSDRVTQRRQLVVTDDYIVLADYLEAPEEHTFDNNFNMKGLVGFDAETISHNRHTDSMDPNPVLVAQFITDCDWYKTLGTTKVSFEMDFGKNGDNVGTRFHPAEGPLKMDVYSAWPTEREMMIGTLPETHNVNRKFWYSVTGDGKTLTEGKFGAWVLGRDEIDLPLKNVKTLTLSTKFSGAHRDNPKTLFWGNPVIVTENGQELKMSDLDLTYDQIDNNPTSGVDYYGGPVKISGQHFEQSLPANPIKEDIYGTISVDLHGLNAVRFKANVGGDFPLGNEDARRKLLSFRTTGKQSEYLTVIEPYEDKQMVQSVTANSANQLTIELADGRTHKLTLKGLAEGENLKVSIKEFKDGKIVREESSD